MPRVPALGLLLALILSPAAAQQTLVITTVAGGGPDNMPALSANTAFPRDLAVDPAGSIFFSSNEDRRVFRIDPPGHLAVFVGGGDQPTSGDGGPARAAGMNPAGLAVDRDGNVFIADPVGSVIRRVDARTTAISTVAGSGRQGFSGDGGPALQADLNFPTRIEVAPGGDLFLIDSGNRRIRRVSAATGIISTVAGDGFDGFRGDGGPASIATLNGASDLALDKHGNLLIADSLNRRVRRVDASTGIINTIAGTGAFGSGGDGGLAASATFMRLSALAVDGADNIFLADSSAHAVRRIDAATGIITRLAGTGASGYSGDGGPGPNAQLSFPSGLAVDLAGGVLVADSLNHLIRRVDGATGVIARAAGNGTLQFAGDGGRATDASLSPTGLLVDRAGDLIIADTFNGRIRRVDALTRRIETISGGGLPRAVTLDHDGNILFADTGGHRVRRLDRATGLLTTIAGTGSAGFSGDGGSAPAARLRSPAGLALDANGDLYIADSDNFRVRRVAASTGVITTVAGNGDIAFTGEGGAATTAGIGIPSGLALDGSGGLLIGQVDPFGPCEGLCGLVLRVDLATGVLSRVAGTGYPPGPRGDGGPAREASLSEPTGLLIDQDGDLLIADASDNLVRRVDMSTGIITTVAGLGSGGRLGDGGAPERAALDRPEGVALDAPGNLYIAESSGGRVRRVGPPGSPPQAVAQAPPEVECSSPAGAPVSLDGSLSTDADSAPGTNDDIILFEWYEEFGLLSQRLLGVDQVVQTELALGSHAITLRVRDRERLSSTFDVRVTVADTTPPVVAASAAPSVLWPPNHRLVTVTMEATAADSCGLASVALAAVGSSEPDDASGRGDGATEGDIRGAELGAADFEILLRAERDASGIGRVYTATYRASDASGNASESGVLVTVPHDRDGVTEPLILSLRETAAGTLLEWTAMAGALSYDAVRGGIGRLRETAEQIDLGPLACIDEGGTDTDSAGHEDREAPPPGMAFFYLVEYDDGARSSFGTEDAARPSVGSGGCSAVPQSGGTDRERALALP